MASKKKETEEKNAFSWSELPSEVQMNVLGWLPLRPLFRSKRVCKLWNSTISSPSFTHFPSRLACSGNRPWLIFFTPKSFDFLLAFDFDGLSWFRFDAGFLSPKLDAFYVQTSSSLPSAQSGFVWCAGTASGLLLLDFRSSLFVSNPLTKSLVKLPAFKSIEVIVTQGFCASPTFAPVKTSDSMSSDAILGTRNNETQGFLKPTSSGICGAQEHFCAAEMKNKVKDGSQDRRPCLCAQDYTIVVIGKANTELVIEAYCLSRNSWEIVGSMPTSIIIRHDQMVECNGVFYSLLLKPFGMLVVGEKNDNGMASWRIEAMPANYGEETRRLLACQNSIFMVCLVDVLNNGFLVCRYEINSRAWIRMRDMPEYILKDVKSITTSNWVDCVGVGNYICFRAIGTLRVLTYDICNELWSWLPDLSDLCDTIFARGYQFEPRLDYTPFF